MHRAAIEAIEHARNRSRRRNTATARRLEGHHIDIDAIAERVRATRRITINFHPDRRDRWGRTVTEGLLQDGRYRTQFETGISNGGRLAGGKRSTWETELFGDAYRSTDRPDLHPIYGTLDVALDPHGGAPRFGSSYLVLAPHCFDRATFTMGDSHLSPTDVGTIDTFGPIVACLLDDAAGGDGLGRGLDPEAITAMLMGQAAATGPARELDGYAEAQVHAGIDLGADVDAIVFDPSFADTAIERELRELTETYGIELRTHGGSVLRPDDVDPQFRGPEIADLAQATTDEAGFVHAAVIGDALAALPFVAPPIDGDPETSPLQRYKKLWHCVLRFGRDAI